jgi:hypothetical protein
MDRRKLLPTLLLGTALAVTTTAVMAKEHGGPAAAQHESLGKDGETRAAGAAGRGDTETADDKGDGSATGEAGGDDGGRDTDNIQFEDQGDHQGDNGVPYLKR